MGRFKLILEVEEFGDRRTFRAEHERDDQSELADLLAYAIHKAVSACCNSPPNTYDMIGQFATEGVARALAYAYRAWDGETNLSECFKLVVDWEKLNSEPELSDVTSRLIAEKHGAVPADAKHVWTLSKEEA